MTRFGSRGGGFRSSRSSGGRSRSAGRRSGGWASGSGRRSSNRGRSGRKSSQEGVVAYSIYNSRGSAPMLDRQTILSAGPRNMPSRGS